MYAFGDDETPLPETVDLVEVSTPLIIPIYLLFFLAATINRIFFSLVYLPQEIVIEYASGVLRKSMDLASLRGKSKPPLKGVGAVTAEDIMSIVKKDPKKFERVKELFELQKELKEARATFEVPDGLGDTEALASLAKDVDDSTAAGAAGEGQV